MFTIASHLTGRTRSTITVLDRIERTLAEGLGFNWYAGYQADTYPAADDDARWQKLLAHADHLGMNFVRFGIGQQASLHAVAVHNLDGSRTLAVVNDAYADPVSIQVNLPGPDGTTYRRIATDHVRKAWVDPKWQQTCSSGGTEFADVVSPVSITVYTTFQIG